MIAVKLTTFEMITITKSYHSIRKTVKRDCRAANGYQFGLAYAITLKARAPP